MTFFDQTSPVSYVCSCGQLKPLYYVYFCRHCFELRCGSCVSSEVDIRFCALCNESLPAAEAWMKKHCCSNCFLCPMCESSLSKRVTSVAKKKEPDEKEKSADGKADTAKAYYLLCPFCHWSTRDIALPDASTSSGPWSETENPNATRINLLVDHFRGVALCDKVRREKKMPNTRRAYAHISGLSAAAVRKRAGLPPNVGLPFRSSEEMPKIIELEGAKAAPAADDLPADVYSVAPILSTKTSMEQRLRIPETMPVDTLKVLFRRKPLMVKRSLRCRVCEHNLIKPEFSPNSIKFKIQLSAYYMIPEVLIKTVEPLRAGKPSELILVFVNPSQHATILSFQSFYHQEPKDPSVEGEEMKSLIPIKATPSFTGTIAFPVVDIPLPDRDDAAEFDDNTEHQNFNDDPSVVLWRKGNRVIVKFRVTPKEDLEVGSPVIVGFTLRHIYTNTVIQQDKKELKKINHAFKLILDVGKSVGQ